MLSGKYLPGHDAPAGSRATDQKGGANTISWFIDDTVLDSVQELRPIAAELGLKKSQLAIAWVLQNPNVASALVGASRPEQVAENVLASGAVLPPEVMTRIDAALGDSIEHDSAQTLSPESRPA